MFTTKRKGIIALLCAVFAAALIACAISLAPSASRTAPVYAAEGDVAAIDGTNYTSLQKAIDAAGNTATTITLLADTAESITIASGQDITLALDGFDITVETGNAITNNGTLTIQGTSFAVISTDDETGYAVNNTGTLAIEGGYFKNGLSIPNAESVSISGGRFAALVPASYLAENCSIKSYYTIGNKGYEIGESTPVAEITLDDTRYVFEKISNACDAAAGGTVTLIADVEQTNFITLDESVTLDLNGYDIEYTGEVNNNLIKVTGENVVITNSSEKESKLINKYGEGGNAYSVIHSEGANLTIENVTIESNGNGVVFFGSLTPAAASEADPDTFNTLSMEGVTVSSYAFALSGNGSSAEDEAWSGTAINITNSTINSAQGCAIYQPQYGILNINGEDTVIEGSSGIEVRAGILNVNAGTIRADWSEFTVYEDAGGASSVDGAAIVVSQHSTNLPISVNLNGGTYSSSSTGGMSVYEADLLNDVATDEIEITIDGGEYKQPVESENVKGFVENGTFSEALPASYVSENAVFYPVETEKGVAYTATTNTGDLSSELSVAQIGNAYYATLQEAIDAAESGATVTLIDNVNEDITVAADDNITIDLNGCTLTGVSEHTITNNGTLVIDDIAGGRVTNSTAGKAAVYNAVEATVTLNGGTYTRGTANEYYVIQNQGTMTINDGVTMLQPSDSSSGLTSGWYTVPDGWDTRANLTINGGVFASNGITVKNDEVSNLTITGGIFDGVDGYVANQSVQNWTYATIEGGTFNGNVISWAYTSGSTVVRGDLDITGGTFNGDIDALYYTGSSSEPDEEENVDISGGAFANAFDESFVAEGSVFYPAEDGTYKVVTEEEFETVTDNAGVALMNGVVYDSLADAVDAAPTDGTQVTITLIDTDGDGIVTGLGVKVVEGKNIVIDFDGLTYDVTNPVGSPGTETNGFQLLKGSTVKMMNGTLVSDTAKILIQNYCDLTIDDMTLDMSDCAQVQYVISNNFGNTVITGDTTIVAAPNQVAFDIYYWPSNGYTDGVSVTFDKNFIGTVTGMVQYGTDSTGATEDNWQTNKANLAIENGTFDITFDVYSGDESDAGITVSGGEFSKEFDSAYVAEGSVLYTTDGDSFTVGTDDEAIDAGIAIIIDGIGYAEVPEGVVATVGAEGEVPAGYESLQDAIDAAADGETVKLLKNITVDGRVNIDKSLTLDMQGYEISGGMLYIKGGTTAGNSITVNISNGSVIGPTYGIIVFNDVTLNIKDVNISAGTHNGIFVPLTAYDGDTTVLPSTINIEGGSVSGGNTESTASVAICGVGDNSETATKLIANGTTFTGGTFGITGNGTAHNTYIELNDCVVTGSVGIYHPQDGDLIINGGEITGDVTGIEIRSGTLTVNGGTITGNGDPFESDPNGNGTTTTGAAIAVSQHTTNLPITVTINGGTFNGVRALYEADLQDEITEGVTIEVTGGTFNGEVYSENCTGFIAGGQFAEKPDDSYLDSEFTGFSEYNGMFIPVSSSTDGTLLEEIAQLRQEIDDAIAAINGELEGGDAATLAEAVAALIGKMNELEDKIAELDENMVTDADLQALRNSITVAYNAAVSRVRAELSAQISDLRDSMAEMGDVSGQLDELKAAYEAADALLSAEIDDLRAELTEADAELVAELDAAISELESTYKAADDAIWNAIYALRDADSGMTTALWVIGVIAVLALCAGVAGVAFAIVRTKRS